MKSVQLLVVAVFCWASFAVAEDEYLIRVATFGYEDRLDFEIEPDDEELSSFEAIVRPGIPFHAKFEHGSIEKKAGRTAITFKGRLTPKTNDYCILEFTLLRTIDTGVRVPVGGGKIEAVLDKNGASAVIGVLLDKPTQVSRLERSSDSRRVVWFAETGEEVLEPKAGSERREIVETRRTKLQQVVRVTRYQPEQD